jgi:hypothetical protein
MKARGVVSGPVKLENLGTPSFSVCSVGASANINVAIPLEIPRAIKHHQIGHFKKQVRGSDKHQMCAGLRNGINFALLRARIAY